jgi:1-acyl-sn-glycerol-3-phosphate acyltransferase
VRALWSILRSVGRSLLFLLLLVAAVVDWWVRRPEVGAGGAVWIHGWSRRIVRCLGFRCEVEGQIPAGGAVVSNHLSYLDILMYSSVRPFVMVAKTEVRGWPLFGWITSRAGTVYVERGGGPKTYPRVNAEMAEAYRSGLPVLFFPEGTTTDGVEVVPFRRGLFHSVLNEGVALRTAALRYELQSSWANEGASVGEDVCWWGEMGFVSHIGRLLGLNGLSVKMRFGDEVFERTDRFVLSETARERVAAMYAETGGADAKEFVEEYDRELAQAV